MKPITKRNVVSVLAYLALITMADTATTSILDDLVNPFKNEGGIHQPGYWNTSTRLIMTSTLFELIGQIILGVIADKKSGIFAMLLNTFSVCLYTLIIAISFAFHEQRNTVVLVVSILAPLARLIAGGSHAATFLTYALLYEQITGSSRIALLFSTGAVVALSHEFATFITSITLFTRPVGLSFILPIICELLTFGIAICYGRSSTSEQSSEPLLFEPAVSELEHSEENTSYGASIISSSKGLRLLVVDKISKDRNLSLLVFIIAVAGVPKATVPLITTYIEHRYGFSPAESANLWLLKLLISIVLFLVVLPLAVYVAFRRELISPSRLTLISAKTSIIITGIGALMIGLALTQPILIAGLVVNSLGVAVDLSVISFIMDFILEGFSGRYFQLLASIESLSVLIGIGVLYPVFQWGLDKSGYAGGTIYYICAVLYSIVAAIIWQLKPASRIRLPDEDGRQHAI